MSERPRPRDARPPDTVPARVLIVDDDERIRRFASKVVTAAGHVIEEVQSVNEALTRFASASYDVALVDLNMPGRSGLDLLAALADQKIDVVPILMTGTTDVGAAVTGIQRGAFDYIAKPVDPAALCWAIERAAQVAHARRREHILESVVSEWAASFDACPDMLMILDRDGRVVRANEAVARVTGVPSAQLAGALVEDLFPGGLGVAIRARQQLSSRADADPTATTREHDPVLDSHFLLSANPIRTNSTTCAVVVRDVTLLVRREEERKRLLQRVLTVQEDERGRIARELHDGIGQALVSLAVGLATIEGEVTCERVPRLRQIAAESLDEVRRLAHGLRPTVLDDMGLTAALKRLTETFTRVHSVRAELLVPEGDGLRLPKDVESALYRIVQEALANVAKHAHARTVDVVLEIDGFARVSITDDGVGFQAPRGSNGATGLGLRGMEERAHLLGGTFRVESVAGRGTTIDVRVPISEGV